MPVEVKRKKVREKESEREGGERNKVEERESEGKTQEEAFLVHDKYKDTIVTN